jgi:hypothetical protein
MENIRSKNGFLDKLLSKSMKSFLKKSFSDISFHHSASTQGMFIKGKEPTALCVRIDVASS